MGFALPGAIAAKLINPDKKVLAVTGDGGFLMNCQEMETAMRLGNPFVTLIFRDNSYGLIKWKQMDQYGKKPLCGFYQSGFCPICRKLRRKRLPYSAGGKTDSNLEEAFAQKVPSIVDCAVDYGENLKLTKYLKELYSVL